MKVGNLTSGWTNNWTIFDSTWTLMFMMHTYNVEESCGPSNERWLSFVLARSLDTAPRGR